MYSIRIWIEKIYFSLLKRAGTGSFWASLLLFPLIPLSLLYGFFFLVIRFLKRAKKKRVSNFCVTVGNIVMGGTGKTPLIAKILQEVGDRRALYVTRGYGTHVSYSNPPSIQKSAEVLFASGGDEALLLARRFPLLQFMISGSFGKTESLSSASVQKRIQSEIDWIIMDDGLQHDEIAFDLKIATVDAKNPYGYSWLLPRGLLRTLPSWALPQVDYIILTNCESLDAVLECAIMMEERWKKPVILMKTVLKRFFSTTGEGVALPAQTSIYIISGIAHPERIQWLLEESIDPFRIKGHYKAPDHASFSIEQIASWLAKEREKESNYPAILISTEKDWVRKEDWNLLPLPIFFMEIDYELLANMKSWLECIQKISCSKKK